MSSATSEIGWIGPITRTRHADIVIVHQGRGVWRTAVNGEPWYITGPVYVTKLEALSALPGLIEQIS